MRADMIGREHGFVIGSGGVLCRWMVGGSGESETGEEGRSAAQYDRRPLVNSRNTTT